MESSAVRIRALFHEKILLYQELVAILQEEKKSLRETDVDALWNFTERKQAIAGEIEKLRVRVLSLLDDLGVDHGMTGASFKVERVIKLLPEAAESDLKEELVALSRFKVQVRDLSRGNKAFVEEYLKVLDEMIVIITNAGNQDTGYTRSCASEPTRKANLLLHKEV